MRDQGSGQRADALAGLDEHPVRPKQQNNTSLNTNTRLSDRSNPRNTTRGHRGRILSSIPIVEALPELEEVLSSSWGVTLERLSEAHGIRWDS